MSLNPRIHYWQGRRVWLVGASSGIGRATAALLHARGAQVIVSARNAQALQAFVDEHPGSVAVPLDTAHTTQVKAAAQQVLAGGPLDLAQYFNGAVDAHGIFQGRSGQIVRRFTVVMECSWKGNEGVLDEAFTYSDGTTQRRIWRLTKHADGHYTGTADDVVGTARGQTQGNAFRWGYTLALPVDGKVYHVDFDDWMYLIDERVMLNRATMSKFGVRLGEITLSFTKRT